MASHVSDLVRLLFDGLGLDLILLFNHWRRLGLLDGRCWFRLDYVRCIVGTDRDGLGRLFRYRSLDCVRDFRLSFLLLNIGLRLRVVRPLFFAPVEVLSLLLRMLHLIFGSDRLRDSLSLLTEQAKSEHV